MKRAKVNSVSVILPCRNEALGLGVLLKKIESILPQAEILVVDDGSTDDSVKVCRANQVTVVSHPYGMGNGAAIKTGTRHAKGDLLVFMDADGQHNPEMIPALLKKLEEGYDMVVGARRPDTHASIFRRFANFIYNKLASLMTGYVIQDLTSGFRVVRARHFIKFLYLLPNGFSYPTTSTMAFFRSGLPVGYLPIEAAARQGKSHIKLFKDGFRFFVIILKIGSLFSPMRLFLPIATLLFVVGLGYYGYTYFMYQRFTNMSALVILSSLLTLLIGLISEQISSLHYRGIDDDARRTKR
ncbi:MAG: glycosyltransferase family 2 protein [Candidatus Thiodiazotropha sp.]|jgi:glycosyltransferase involved in cell wall biosynthesis